MRAVRILGLTIAGFFALLLVALLAIWLLVDPNDYKDRITAAVKASTGRTLSLPGDLKLSIFPWLAVQTGEASLGNPAGFGDEPFLTLKHASLSVKLLPLLQKQLEVGRVEIDGLDLRLRQDAAGKGNWEDWGASPSSGSSESTGTQALQLAGVSLSNSRIAFEDMVAQDVNIAIGRIAPGAAIPVDLQMKVVTAPGAKPLPLKAAFKLLLDLERQRYQLADLALSGSVHPEDAPAALDWKFAAPTADLDLAAQTLARTTYTAQVGSAALAGSIAGTQLIDAPSLSGHFELKELAPRQLLKEFGIAAPVTRDAAVLARFAAQGDYSWHDGQARASDLKLALDESKLSGRFAYDTGTSGMDFALTLDRIDLDRYQPPPTDPKAATTQPIELPVDFLKPLRAKGSFAVGEIRIGGARLTQLSAGISVADAVARFAPLKAQLYGGQYSGDIGIDMRQAAPRLTMDEHMSGIDIAQLMKEYANSERLSGKGSLDVKLAASGRNGDALLKTLTGAISTNLANGAIEGIDIWYAIAQAQSLIQKRQLASVSNTKRTVFETFKASADVVNGVATTKDLAVASQLLRITGNGSTNLVTQALDYNISATVVKAPPGADDGTAQLARATIPVKITGTLADPKIRPDLAGMAKERVKQEVEKRTEEVTSKVKDKVQNKLKELFKR